MDRPILERGMSDLLCLNSIIRNSYGEDIKKATFAADKVRRVEGEILKRIMSNSTFGIAHQDLADGVGLDRKNLRPYVKRLIHRNLITRAPGKQGKYFPTTNVYQDALLTANFFGEVSVSRLLSEEKYVVPEQDGCTYSKYISPKFTEESSLQRSLFEFSSKIGAFITYVLIQAMNPKNEYVIKSEEKDLDRDALVQEWTQSAISSIIPCLLRQFKSAIFSNLDSIRPSDIRPSDLDPKKIGDFVADYYWNKPRYQMKAKTIAELDQAFEALYPIVKYQLDAILKGLPIAIENYQIRTDYYQIRRRLKNNCKHEFQVAKERLVILDGARYWVPDDSMHCPKCHYTKFHKSKH
ncbi:hypothetical protein BH18THE2_BH18THE2_20500 [soil metagenome]